MKKKNNAKGKTAEGNRSFLCTGLSPVSKGMEKFKIIILTIAMGYKKAKLGFSIKTGDADFLINSMVIASILRENKSGFYSPKFEDLDLWDAQNIAFGKSISAVKLGGLGKAAAKNTIKIALKGTLDDMLAYINRLAKKKPLNSEAIVTGALLMKYGSRRMNKQDLGIKSGLADGEIKLTTIAEKIDGKYVRASYNWRFSVDNGKTWSEYVTSDGAKYTYTNMKSGVPTLFQKRSLTSKGGWSAWCAAVEFTL